MTYSFDPQAEAEYLNSVGFYLNRSVHVGEKFVREVEVAIHRILENPRAWPEIDPGVRRYLVQQFTFAIFYAIRQHDILILAVAHTSRRPGYWQNRIK